MEATAINILVLEPDDYSRDALNIYAKAGVIKLFPELSCSLEAAIANAHTVVVRLGYKLDETLLSRAANLKCIVSPTTGLDHIDEAYCKRNGIRIVSLQGETDFLASIPSTAELTWGLLLALIRHIPAASLHVAALGWDRNLFKGNNLAGKKLGILGLGRVGKQVAGYAKAFGMTVQACDPYSGQWIDGVKQMTDAAQLFSTSDIISIHIPAAGNDGFVSARLLGLLKPHALLINTSRGSVWDEAAVAASLKNEKIAGVATDVIAHELDAGARLQSPLLQLAVQQHPHLIVTPHIAGATHESMHATEHFVAEKWKQQFGI